MNFFRHEFSRNQNHSLEKLGEIIGIDYNPIIITRIIIDCNRGGMQEKFVEELEEIFRITIKNRSIVKAVYNKDFWTSKEKIRISKLFHKYKIKPQIPSLRYSSTAITMQRMAFAFPNVLARVYKSGLDFKLPVSPSILEKMGLINVSPAVYSKSSILLLPKFENDIKRNKFLQILKAMFLYQHELLKVSENEQKQMLKIIENSKRIWDSEHILGDERWLTCQLYLLWDVRVDAKYGYSRAAEYFDEEFPEMNSAIKHLFILNKGTGRTSNVRKVRRGRIVGGFKNLCTLCY